MFFRNLTLYRLPTPWNMDLAKLEEMLARNPFTRCSGSEQQRSGWISPRDKGSLVYAQNRQWLIALCTEQRLLPSSVIQDEVRERAEALEEQQGYAPGRKQLRELKDRVAEELLPRAFTRRRTTFVWIDPVNGWLAVDASALSKAEEVLEQLRMVLDDFPLSLVHTKLSHSSAMADWLAGGEAPVNFTVDRDCELKAVGEEKAAVRYVRHPLDGDGIASEIKAHLAAGKLPTRLALTWNDRISFVLTERLEIKRLGFLDLLMEEAEKNTEHAEEKFDADFALMTGELARFIPSLLDALGGEVVEDRA
ncbi:recombination-associated protein RdgC [Azospira sp. I09]|uniref:recombination-associated protein RdgC n=1 Tax=Azospira sp. I09 TaxID=1765049 RepID=UPI0012613058|nr:recombination-associated protein RdgC [Azospira sp. I09]BBN90823.1 recombination-associated protein RdgC [Azospira sp. I09]